jgi:hypothetical protein
MKLTAARSAPMSLAPANAEPRCPPAPGLLLSDIVGLWLRRARSAWKLSVAIVVTKLGTTFLLAYRKSADEERLVLRRSRIPPTTTSLRSAFRAQAWQAANDKAPELGWIV